MNKKITLAICAVLIAALVCGIFLVKKEADAPIENAGTAQNAPVAQVSLTYQGEEYPLKENLQTVLLIGTDGDKGYQPKESGRQDYFNFDQADVLLLLVMDKAANTAEVIQLNRDTMSYVPWLDVLGRYGGTEYKQLCLAFNSGDGGPKSCKNTVDAVSRLLMNAPIQSYIQIPMGAIAVLNDLAGGVPVTITEDLTSVDPAFLPGTTLRLSGSQAESFLRARMTLEDDRNQTRMGRHREYITSFQSCAKEALNTDSQFAMKLVEKLGEYMQSNLTAQQLAELVEWLNQAEIAPIGYADGELVRGEEFYEFYVDEASLWALVKNAYCK